MARVAAFLNRLSVPVLAAGLYLSGYAAWLGPYERLRAVIVVLMVIGAWIGGLMIVSHGLQRRMKPVVVCGTFLVGLTLASLTLASQTRGDFHRVVDWNVVLRHAVQLTLVCGWFLYCAHMEWGRRFLWSFLSPAGMIVTGANLVLWFQSGFEMPFAGLSTGKNALATLAVTSSFVAIGTIHHARGLLTQISGGLLLIFSVFTLVASGGRSAMLALAVAALVYGLWPVMVRSSMKYRSCFVGLVITCIAVPVFYLNFHRLSVFREMEEFSRRAFGMSIYTGRDDLWPGVMDGIRERPVLGQGSKAYPRFKRRTRGGVTLEQSAHNLYLSTLYQAGLVGLTGLVLFLGAIWWRYYDTRFLQMTRISAAFFVAILLRENFEVSLTHNNLQWGLGEWALIASGVSPWAGGLTAGPDGRAGRTHDVLHPAHAAHPDTAERLS